MTRSVRLTFAGAHSERAVGTDLAAPSLGPLGLGRGSGLIQQPGLELLLDLHEVLGIGLEVAGMGPLEARLKHTAYLPIDVAQMIIDRGILGLEFDRAFEMLDGFLVVPEPVIGPAERV